MIEQADVLHALFDKVTIPQEVCDELAHREAPEVVRKWLRRPPTWLHVHAVPTGSQDPELESLDPGEKSALILAMSLGADLLLLDDRNGVRLARRKGLRVIGTLRVLQLAAKGGLLDLAESFERIKRTNFRYRQEIMDALLGDLS